MARPKTVIPSLRAVKDYVGQPLGPSEWIEVTQQRIDDFARATDDRQWIHCDVERAVRESPWKTTIAHGYLTLALTPRLLNDLVEICGWKTAVNVGLDRMRLSSPVPSGARIRMHAEIADAREVPRGGVRVSYAVRIEVEGYARAALVARVNYAYFGAGPAVPGA